jgi:hypothetical protein
VLIEVSAENFSPPLLSVTPFAFLPAYGIDFAAETSSRFHEVGSKKPQV